MTLRIDVENVENFEEKCYVIDGDDGNIEYTAIYQVLSMLTVSCGFSAITAKNWKKIYERIFAIERALGGMRRDQLTGESVKFTPEEVREFIGLRANVIDETDASFRKRVYEMLKDSAQREIRKLEDATD